MPSDRLAAVRRHLRLLALFGVLVAFDGLAVVAAYALAHVSLAITMAMQFNLATAAVVLQFDVVPLDLVVVVGTPVALVAQVAFGYQSTLRDVNDFDAPSADDARTDRRSADLRARVSKLAHAAGTSPPDVSLVAAETPNSFVVSRPGKRTLFATTGLLDELDGDELDAVLAHELAHLKNGDAFVMTAAAFLPTMSSRFVRSLVDDFEDGWLCARLRGDDADLTRSDLGQLYSQILTLLFGLVALPVVGALYLASTACYRLLSRVREYGADAGGVAICGSAADLASALETLTEDRRPRTDLRTAPDGVRELCILPYAVGTTETDDGSDGDRFDRIAAVWSRFCGRVLPGSHPDAAARIAALRDEAATDGRPGQ